VTNAFKLGVFVTDAGHSQSASSMAGSSVAFPFTGVPDSKSDSKPLEVEVGLHSAGIGRRELGCSLTASRTPVVR
jgi:hypothetical protein